MEVAVPLSWKEQFRLAAEDRIEDLRWQARMARFEARQQEERATQLAQEKQAAEERAFAQQVWATEERVELFTRKLDRHDTVTVEALMENRIALDRVREQFDTMLMEAHVLPDGRRVFKTRDGTRVFDEHGSELKPEVVDPNTIDDTRPRWEEFKDVRDTKLALEKERQDLLDYQSRLDGVRERVGKDRIIEKDLADLGAELDKEMPDAIRRKLDGDKPQHSADVNSDRSRAPSSPVTRDDLAPLQAAMLAPVPR